MPLRLNSGSISKPKRVLSFFLGLANGPAVRKTCRRATVGRTNINISNQYSIPHFHLLPRIPKLLRKFVFRLILYLCSVLLMYRV